MQSISKEESLLLQCLATTSLLAELSNSNFIESKYFEELTFENESYKNILKITGLGNPATMQMMLYALLTVPKEILSRTSYTELEIYVAKINPLVKNLIENESFSTYENEESKDKIDYFRHIRNAVAHSKCSYFSENQKNYVVFTDNNNSKNCSIKMECSKVGLILMGLQKLIIEYYNNRHS